MITLIRVLLQIVVLIVKHQNDKKQQQIGADNVIKMALLDIAINTRIAKQIDEDSRNWGANDIDQRLSDYYRD